jgi:sulfide dehydrogenase cytochrome subunit
MLVANRSYFRTPESMPMKPAARFTSLLCLALLAAGNAAAVEELVTNCNDCHGDNGVSQWNDMPTIAGLDAFTSSEALYAYQEKARPCGKSEYRQGDTSRPPTDMCAVAADLSEEDIDALAEHYAALPFVPADQEFDPALAEKGKAVHMDGCERCHSDGGSNTEDEASILAGQRTGYLKQAFSEYASGDREQLDKMKAAMDKLSADDVTALLHYYASQQ